MIDRNSNLISLDFVSRWQLALRFRLSCALWCTLLLCITASATAQRDTKDSKPAAKPTRLIDRQPFDRITVNGAGGREAIDTLLLELPNRRVPNPLPNSGALELRRLSEPSTLYNVPWSSVVQIEFFEDLLLKESIALTRAKQLADSYEYLNFLHNNYPSLNGLSAATAGYLRVDARATYDDKKYEETLTILLALYDLDPGQRGLGSFVELVTDRMITDHLSDKDFKSARSVLDLLKGGFPKLGVSNIASWQQKFEQGAARQIKAARQALAQQRYPEARLAVRRAIDILPDARGTREMMAEIDRKSPQLVVAVDQVTSESPMPLTLESRRLQQLLNPKLVDLVGFGTEGGDYSSRWATLASDDTGLELGLSLNQFALAQGITAEGVALELLRQANPASPQYRVDFAELLQEVEISRGDRVTVHWQRSHVRPESLLSLPLLNLGSQSDQGLYLSSREQNQPNAVTYRATKKEQPGPQTLIEKHFENEEVAFAQLINGEVDVIARVPPWQLRRMQQTPGIVVGQYRLPTVHVLLPNYQKPLMGRREFRRAICYGINRKQILDSILLGGSRQVGYRVLSAPLPAGKNVTDPVGYAYLQGQQPRTYEPRLAAVLGSVARNSLAKLAAMNHGGSATKSSTDEEGSSTKSEGSAGKAGSATKKESSPAKVEPLVLAYSANPVATAACQSIKLHLGAIGISVQLKPIANVSSEDNADYDLLYAELAIWEPMADVRRLLGPQGIAGRCSSPMSLALHDVEQSNNWAEARQRLNEVHEIAFNDLPMIPLWQTIDYFAHRESLQGVGQSPVTIYQNINQWRRASSGGRR